MKKNPWASYLLIYDQTDPDDHQLVAEFSTFGSYTTIERKVVRIIILVPVLFMVCRQYRICIGRSRIWYGRNRK